MSRDRKIALTVLILASLVTAAGCNKALDYFREKHPDPPPGLFPRQVGKMVLDDDARWEKNPNCTRADPLHCWAYYILPGGDNELTRTHYFVQIYDSPEEADARIESYAGEGTLREHELAWEDRPDKDGKMVKKLLIKNAVFREEDRILGFCSVSFSQGVYFINVIHGYECEPAKQFYKDLIAITE